MRVDVAPPCESESSCLPADYGGSAVLPVPHDVCMRVGGSRRTQGIENGCQVRSSRLGGHALQPVAYDIRMRVDVADAGDREWVPTTVKLTRGGCAAACGT
jgi:hypothetical protein